MKTLSSYLNMDDDGAEDFTGAIKRVEQEVKGVEGHMERGEPLSNESKDSCCEAFESVEESLDDLIRLRQEASSELACQNLHDYLLPQVRGGLRQVGKRPSDFLTKLEFNHRLEGDTIIAHIVDHQTRAEGSIPGESIFRVTRG